MKVMYSSVFILIIIVLSGCKNKSDSIFTHEQILALQNAGFQPNEFGWTLGMSEKILFGKNESQLCPETRKNIDLMAQRFSSLGLKHMQIEGHTDIYGTVDYNQNLSLIRANVVAEEWIKFAKIPKANIVVYGFGKQYPIASNHTSKGRAENRRVSIVIRVP